MKRRASTYALSPLSLFNLPPDLSMNLDILEPEDDDTFDFPLPLFPTLPEPDGFLRLKRDDDITLLYKSLASCPVPKKKNIMYPDTANMTLSQCGKVDPVGTGMTTQPLWTSVQL
jgi:hypothetical protein